MTRRKPAVKAGRRHPVALVLGGARSGKSTHAEALARGLCRAPSRALYLATGEARDGEMAARIAEHRSRRGPIWATHEEPLDIAPVIAAKARPGAPVLVDCLTLWLANLMAAGRDIAAETTKLCAALSTAKGPVVLVSNEVGLGIVPDNRAARDFRDHAGRLHQAVGAIASDVVFVAAGLPLVLKGKKR